MLKKFNRLLAIAAALFAGVGAFALPPTAVQETPKRTAEPTVGGDQNAIVERAIRRRQLALAREAAAERVRPAREAAKAARAAAKGKGVATTKVEKGVAAPPGIMNPLGTPDYMSGLVPNYANSPIIRKFVDTLPGLGAANANNLGNFIPIATPNTTAFPGSDYYDIDLVDYTQQLHSDLPPTKLRGYKDKNAGADGQAHYLGPVIIAQRDRPVRVKFNNKLGLGAAGNLPIPVDTTLMGAGMAPTGSFTQNRAELHLHGGLSPWISDGTPHQWITPAGDPTPNKKGVAFQHVPDMGSVLPGGLNNPADGIATYFYTNAQSGRFMFYHDHSFGLTRLNVYMGEAAGYLIVDPVETKLIADGILPSNGGGVYNYGIPLVFQDKTFVPGPSDLAYQDPTWDTTNWGGYGDLWYPHVYMPNQNPDDPAGANAMGRWDYGPWFWPPLPVATTDVTPVNTIPKAHGPVPGANPGEPSYPGTPNPSLTPEAFMDTPLVNGTPYPKLTVLPQAYRFRLLNASNDRPFGFAFFEADPAAPTEVKMVDASPVEAAWAAEAGLVDAAGVSLWPTDGRAGGVVDWRTIGPDIIVIGNESGFLPAPVKLKSQATTYNYNRRDIVVLDIQNHPLFLAPAERADIIVDFSAWAGKTLILYNDMLAPVPAFDVRYDYFTGAPDQTATGGAPSTLAGYGPHTRTLMQIQVANTTPAAAFNFTALENAFKSTPTSNGAFAATQHPPIVPQTFYNSAMNTNYAADTYATIQAYELPYTRTENGQPVVMPLQPKAIQELFELDYGRMNATLGVELPFTNFNNQTTIPLGYAEPATEILTDGTTQLWKITHNGVDTHPVHFHLFDVQIVNRVGWDGAVRFPEANELGWKETVRMKPLEDIIVAMRPLSPKLPFVLGNSVRSIDPTKTAISRISVTDLAAGAPNQGNLGNPIQVSNSNGTLGATPDLDTVGAGYDYGWEYVWHCHILGHEENDFMRPLVLNVAGTVPTAPTALAATGNGPTRVDLAWTDGSANETGFRIERNPGPAGEPAFTKLGTTVPDQNNFTDFTVVSGTSYSYRVFAYNQAGDSSVASNTVTLTPGAVTNPTSVALVAAPVTSAPKGTAVTFTATPTGGTGHQFQFLVDGVIVQAYSSTNTYVLPGTTLVGTYAVTVNARTSLASTVVTATIPYTVTPTPATGVQLLPNYPSPRLAGKGITFTAAGIGSSAYQYQFMLNNGSGNVIVQNYSPVATYTLDPFIAAGLINVTVNVRTNPAAVVPEATAAMNYTILAGTDATGVTLTPSLPTPQLFGTPVTFTAAGSGATGGVYEYSFFLTGDGGATWTNVQPYSTNPSWIMPGTTPASASYGVVVYARAGSGAVRPPVSAITFYAINSTTPTSATITPTLPSPQLAGTPVTFNATGVGASNYQYAFYTSNNNGVSWVGVQGFSPTASWTMPGSTPAGTYVVVVQVRSGTNPGYVSAVTTFVVN